MRTISKIFLLLTLCAPLAHFLLPREVSAATLSPAEIQSQINQISDQIKALTEQIGKLSAPHLKAAPRYFSSDLWFGMRQPSAVVGLQEFLIARGYLADHLATGNFLSLTKAAVQKFQEDNGIVTTGFFGPITRARANALLESDFLSSYVLLPEPAYDLSGIEGLIYGAVNAERAVSSSLPLLVWDDALASVARAHSEDQARDNVALTNPDLPCAYPFIRHEGFLSGLSVGDRLAGARIPFRIAGENIIALSAAVNLVYVATAPVPACASLGGIDPSSTPLTLLEAQTRVAKEIQNRLALVSGEQPVKWVNREWMRPDEIASTAAKDWVASEGHKKNIFNVAFVKTGVGVAEINGYLIVTQVFIGN